jgi:putative endonuclease
MSNWKVYLLTCKDGTYYCGITNKPVEERVKVHNAGKGSKYTRSRIPVTLTYYLENLTHSESAQLEYKVKKLSRQKKLDFFKNYQQPR